MWVCGVFLYFKLKTKLTNQNSNKTPTFLAVQSHIGTQKKMSLLEIRGSRQSGVVRALKKTNHNLLAWNTSSDFTSLLGLFPYINLMSELGPSTR